MDTSTQTTPPVTFSLTVNASPQRAFEVFTDQVHSWWPTEYHIGDQQPEAIVIEPHGGGRWFERAADGAECNIGTVLAWEPPHRLVLAWQLNGRWAYEPDLDLASEVEVRFVEDAPGRTRVELCHSKLERHGADAAAVHGGVSAEAGWPMIMGRYASAVNA
jgi:uncharacterized protein YndB with AHSA1/START domain